MTTIETYHYTVLAEHANLRLDKFIALNIPDITRTRVQNLIKEGHVSLLKAIISNCSYRVKPDETYTIEIPEATPSHMSATSMPLDIAFEDEHMLVINKQSGMTVHPGAGNHNDTMVNALLAYCGDNLSGIGGVSRPGIVHRLDKDTSGLMVVAKTDKAHQSLSNQIADRTLKRRYYAIAWGAVTPKAGIITTQVTRSPRNRKKMAVCRMGGKKAITHYQTKEIFGSAMASLVECRLETGRTHQIRLHMTHTGHGLIGDQTYGSTHRACLRQLEGEAHDFVGHFPRQALHSHSIAFCHPETEEIMAFDSPLPEDMAKLLEFLRATKV